MSALNDRRDKIQTAFFNRKREGDGQLVFAYNQDTAKAAVTAGDIKKSPGSQNKHHGSKPGSYKHRRNLVKLARRRNRGN